MAMGLLIDPDIDHMSVAFSRIISSKKSWSLCLSRFCCSRRYIAASMGSIFCNDPDRDINELYVLSTSRIQVSENGLLGLFTVEAGRMTGLWSVRILFTMSTVDKFWRALLLDTFFTILTWGRRLRILRSCAP